MQYDEHGGRGLAGVEPAHVDLPDVGDEIGLGVAGVAEERDETAEELVVGDELESAGVFHIDNIGSGSATFWDRA